LSLTRVSLFRAHSGTRPVETTTEKQHLVECVDVACQRSIGRKQQFGRHSLHADTFPGLAQWEIRTCGLQKWKSDPPVV
jgi:hypothetical protein